jgi:guanidinoacetate N-methyltransferase
MAAIKINPFIGDAREKTYNERLKIGYDNVRDEWSEAPAHFDDSTLKICGHPVMEGWEDNYMKKLAEIATSKKGIVLEVGFGMGISANYIQNGDIEKHIIIEANKDVFDKAGNFACQAKKPVELIFGFWEEAIKQISENAITGILFDTYPLSEKEIHTNHFCFFDEAYRVLKPGGVFTYYSDEIFDFSPEHRRCLEEAGFKNIYGQVCKVNPPEGCQYWKSDTILAPIITK